MILSSPVPQFGQRCMSISKAQASAKTNLYSSYVVAKTRLSSRAQLMRAGRTWTVSASHWTPDAPTPGTSSSLGGPCGTTSERSFAFGASTPWKRIRCSLGRGTSAASRCMNSNGLITRCVVPSRQGVLVTTQLEYKLVSNETAF